MANNTIARHRTPGSPSDEEQAISSSSEQQLNNEKTVHRRKNSDNELRHLGDRFLRRGKTKVGTIESLKNIALSSWLNLFLIVLPVAWAAHFGNASGGNHIWPYPLTFALCFLSIIPLAHLFEYGGEQMSYYCGKDLGDLIVVTLNNAVEATLAVILLTKCEQVLKTRVVILHLLLIPGVSFIIGGARIMQQELHPHLSQLNHTLLTIGECMTLLLPAAFFAAIGRAQGETTLDDATHKAFLQMSRGLAIILLAVYVCSRFYLHNPPGDDNAFRVAENAPAELKHQEEHLANTDPEVNVWVCMTMLAITIALMAVTAEWLVDSIEFVREQDNIREGWFGLILLPIISFSADGAIACGFFVRYLLKHYLGTPTPPETLAKATAIDLSIQFTLFWMPLIVLIGWWSDKPMILLFDLFHVALLLGACILINYITADAKTNWAEGFAMVAFYLMIALVAWWYPGQTELHQILACAGEAPAE
ncbi:hypothetical protein C8J56DRAFT_1136827 [Mycena floridula]|nr:hypothetical protein C8J56DRAFT_1136827 [Mycena floridula]